MIRFSTRTVARRRIYRAEVGRWRFSVRFGHYRTGFRCQSSGAYDGALPFLMLTALRRTAEAVRRGS